MKLTHADLARIGELTMNAAAVSVQLGHVSPAESVLYMASEDGDHLQRFVLDLLVAGKDPVARERMRKFVDDARWLDRVAEAVVR